MTDTPEVPATVAVAVQSGWYSKINWGEAIKVLAAVLTLWGITLDPATQASILGVIVGAGAVYTFIMKTFYTKTVTPASVANATTRTMPAKAVVKIT